MARRDDHLCQRLQLSDLLLQAGQGRRVGGVVDRLLTELVLYAPNASGETIIHIGQLLIGVDIALEQSDFRILGYDLVLHLQLIAVYVMILTTCSTAIRVTIAKETEAPIEQSQCGACDAQAPILCPLHPLMRIQP